MIFFLFYKMARYLNINCDFSTGYLVCDIPRHTIEVKIKMKTRWVKHTLTHGKERRMEKFRKHIPKIKISTARKVVYQNQKKIHDSGSFLGSETWIQVGESFGYVSKYFQDSAPHFRQMKKMNHPMTLKQY